MLVPWAPPLSLLMFLSDTHVHTYIFYPTPSLLYSYLTHTCPHIHFLTDQGVVQVRELLHKRIRDTYLHPQFNTDVMKPLNIEALMDQEVCPSSTWWPHRHVSVELRIMSGMSLLFAFPDLFNRWPFFIFRSKISYRHPFFAASTSVVTKCDSSDDITSDSGLFTKLLIL
jgi:hypothetical protein